MPLAPHEGRIWHPDGTPNPCNWTTWQPFGINSAYFLLAVLDAQTPELDTIYGRTKNTSRGKNTMDGTQRSRVRRGFGCPGPSKWAFPTNSQIHRQPAVGKGWPTKKVFPVASERQLDRPGDRKVQLCILGT
eukprot:gene7557-biopygen3061